ncbi:MAG: hypothetical protein KKG60_01460 [Nanoarchaeota archaeon]|nr:hypothetical protein [Nanoarchaeota archaeon]
MESDYHIDLSHKLWAKKTTGIACVNSMTKEHNGCVLTRQFKESIKKDFFKDFPKRNYARLYALCIYYLIRDKEKKIRRLIICNDEHFDFVKEYLVSFLNKKPSFDIISINEFRISLGRNIKSPADNSARSYRKRGSKRSRWSNGKKLNVIKITYKMIKEKW